MANMCQNLNKRLLFLLQEPAQVLSRQLAVVNVVVVERAAPASAVPNLVPGY